MYTKLLSLSTRESRCVPPRGRAKRFRVGRARRTAARRRAASPPAPRCAFAPPYLNEESMLCYLFRSVITMFRCFQVR